MKKSILLLTITMLMSACGNKAAQAASDANKTDSALADKESIAVADAPTEDEQAFNKFFDQLRTNKPSTSFSTNSVSMILLPCSRLPTTTLPRNADYRLFILLIANLPKKEMLIRVLQYMAGV